MELHVYTSLNPPYYHLRELVQRWDSWCVCVRVCRCIRFPVLEKNKNSSSNLDERLLSTCNFEGWYKIRKGHKQPKRHAITLYKYVPTYSSQHENVLILVRLLQCTQNMFQIKIQFSCRCVYSEKIFVYGWEGKIRLPLTSSLRETGEVIHTYCQC